MDLVERLLHLHYDNRATELYCNSDKSSTKSNHIDVKFLVIRIEFGITLSVDSISTILNITDLLTKRLSSKVFLEHVAH